MVGGEDRFHVADHLFGLFFNRLSRQVAGFGIYRTGSRHEDEVARAPAL